MAIALLCLGGVFISTYMWMYKLGLIGTIACGSGGCETVQLSPQARFLGVEVALIGLVGYAAMLAVALVSLQPQFTAGGWPVRALVWLSGGAVAFTVYLTALELFVIHAICRWCVGSAVVIVLVFALSVMEARQARAGSA
jgi:uncharacterized membrane protein